MDLAEACTWLHALACIATIAFAVAKRRSAEKHDTLALAVVWCAWFAMNFLHDATLAALPAPSPTPLSTVRDRVLLAANGALYFAAPLGLAAWIRWTFLRAQSWWLVGAWLLAVGVPTLTYPLIRGSSWFRLAAVVHIVAFVLEVSAIVKWTKRREKPQPWHGVAIAASWVSTMPAIPFLIFPESGDSYGIWLLRAVVALHLWVIALVGGTSWK